MSQFQNVIYKTFDISVDDLLLKHSPFELKNYLSRMFAMKCDIYLTN